MSKASDFFTPGDLMWMAGFLLLFVAIVVAVVCGIWWLLS